MLRVVKFICVLVVLCLGIAIALTNATPVTVNYLAGQVDLSLVVVTIGAMAFGFVLALVLCLSRIVVLRAEARRLRKHLRNMEAELKNRRNLPLQNV